MQTYNNNNKHIIITGFIFTISYTSPTNEDKFVKIKTVLLDAINTSIALRAECPKQFSLIKYDLKSP